MEFYDGTLISISDFPGIIEDASKGKGLGIQFLKHMLKSKMLIFVVDCSEAACVSKFEILMHEVHSFDPSFRLKPFLIVCTKADLDSD